MCLVLLCVFVVVAGQDRSGIAVTARLCPEVPSDGPQRALVPPVSPQGGDTAGGTAASNVPGPAHVLRSTKKTELFTYLMGMRSHRLQSGEPWGFVSGKLLGWGVQEAGLGQAEG